MAKKKKPISRLYMSDEEIANRADQYAKQFNDYQKGERKCLNKFPTV